MTKYKCLYDITGRIEDVATFLVPLKDLPKQEQGEPVKAMTAARAEYFMRRFKHEEKLLGPNEQAAVDFVIAMLEAAQQRKPQGYAGIMIWGGDATVTKVFTELQIKMARDPSELIKRVVQQCLDELSTHGAKDEE
jgi:hypothetical protein